MWAVVAVAVLGLAWAAKRCGSRTDQSAQPPQPASTAPAAQAPQPMVVEADHEASSNKYRMQFKLGSPVSAPRSTTAASSVAPASAAPSVAPASAPSSGAPAAPSP